MEHKELAMGVFVDIEGCTYPQYPIYVPDIRTSQTRGGLHHSSMDSCISGWEI